MYKIDWDPSKKKKKGGSKTGKWVCILEFVHRSLVVSLHIDTKLKVIHSADSNAVGVVWKLPLEKATEKVVQIEKKPFIFRSAPERGLASRTAAGEGTYNFICTILQYIFTILMIFSILIYILRFIK